MENEPATDPSATGATDPGVTGGALPAWLSGDAFHWMSFSLDAARPLVKGYHWARLGGHACGIEMVDAVLGEAETDPSRQQLIAALRQLEARPGTCLAGEVLQVRAPDMAAKIYLRVAPGPNGSVAGASSQILQLLRQHGEPRAVTLVEEIRRRHAIAPLHLVSLAFRPEMEIETYHDCLAAGLPFWTPEDARRIIAGLETDPDVVGTATGIIAMMHEAGLSCTHVSRDLLRGDGDLTVTFDPRGELELETCLALARQLGHRIPDDLPRFLLEEGVPIDVSVKTGPGKRPHLIVDAGSPAFARQV